MQRDPHYALASLDVADYLARRVAACEAAGIARQRIVVDPGIGFGKTVAHNLEILARLTLLPCARLRRAGRPVAQVDHRPRQRRRAGRSSGWPGSIAGALHALSQGVQILRVHDVAETQQAIAALAGDRRRRVDRISRADALDDDADAFGLGIDVELSRR